MYWFGVWNRYWPAVGKQNTHRCWNLIWRKSISDYFYICQENIQYTILYNNQQRFSLSFYRAQSLLSSRLLIGLRLIRLIQHRLWNSRLEVWFFTSVASSVGEPSVHTAAGSVVSSLWHWTFGQGCGGVIILAALSVTFGVSASCEGLVSESVLGSVCSSWAASLEAGKASLGDCSGNRGGFSVISLSLTVLEQSCSCSPPNWWQSSLTMTSQSPSSSTSKLRWGSCSLFIRTWGTSWGMESGWDEERPVKYYKFVLTIRITKAILFIQHTWDEGNWPNFKRWTNDNQKVHLIFILLHGSMEHFWKIFSEEDNIGLHDCQRNIWTPRTMRNNLEEKTCCY